jgi:hypothetical protein
MKNATKKIVLTQKGEVNKAIKNALSNCRFDVNSNKIYTGYYSGKGRFATACSAQNTVISILKAQGYKYEIGNDAPRGGANGDFVKVSKTAFNFLKSI